MCPPQHVPHQDHRPPSPRPENQARWEQATTNPALGQAQGRGSQGQRPRGPIKGLSRRRLNSPAGCLEPGGPLKSAVPSELHPGPPGGSREEHSTLRGPHGKGAGRGPRVCRSRITGQVPGDRRAPRAVWAPSDPPSPPTGHHKGGTRAATPHETTSPDVRRGSSTNAEELCSHESPSGPLPRTKLPEGGSWADSRTVTGGGASALSWGRRTAPKK